jgi:hypothetical protein
MKLQIAILAAAVGLTACAGSSVAPVLSPRTANTDALLVLPGFGYGGAGERAFRAAAASMAREGVDVYVADYVTRGGLESSRAKLQRFIDDKRLRRYGRLHIFAFLAGAWTINPLLERQELPNLATIVYDRSPFQERAPHIAETKLHFLTWVRYGSTVFDVADTAYPPMTAPAVHVGRLVESAPTRFITRHRDAARQYGPFAFGCDSFGQRYDDCVYLPLNHNEMYSDFTAVWPDVLTFIRQGRFSEAAERTPPAGDPLSAARRK